MAEEGRGLCRLHRGGFSGGSSARWEGGISSLAPRPAAASSVHWKQHRPDWETPGPQGCLWGRSLLGAGIDPGLGFAKGRSACSGAGCGVFLPAWGREVAAEGLCAGPETGVPRGACSLVWSGLSPPGAVGPGLAQLQAQRGSGRAWSWAHPLRCTRHPQHRLLFAPLGVREQWGVALSRPRGGS